jgi:type IV pilus assembly protein PilC
MLNFAQLSRFYNNLATLDQAGLTYLKAFEGFKRTEKDPDQIYKIQFMISHIQKNRPLSDGFKFIKYVPAFDIPLIKAAEASGRLVEVFKILSKKYADAVVAEKEIRGQLIQPFITFIVALFVPSFPDLFTNKISLAVYLRNSLGILILVCAAIYTLYRSWMKSFYDLAMARKLYSFFSHVPFFKGLNQKIALHKFASGLGMMLDSGMDLFDSLKQASQCSGDPQLASAIEKFIPMLKQGADLTKAFQTVNYFPGEFVNAVSLGNDSGKLPEFLRNYSQQLQDEIDMKVKVLTKVVPIIIYIVVTVYVASIILKFYTGHLNEVMDVIKDV